MSSSSELYLDRISKELGVFDHIPTGEDQRLTVTTAAVVQFSVLPSDTMFGFWTSEDNDIRFTLDGSNPNANNGHLIIESSVGIWNTAWLSRARFIAIGGTGIIHMTPGRVHK